MNRRGTLSLLVVLGLCALPATLPSSTALAQSADIDGVKAASNAFYEALAVLDDGTAMGKVWAPMPYVTYVSPTMKTVIVGWEAQKKTWPANNGATKSRSVKMTDAHIHVNGNLAWEIGTEAGEVVMNDGAVRAIDVLTTNVYEKIDGRWLMVSHHAAMKPK